MRQITVNVYEYRELPETAKKVARHNHAVLHGYLNMREACDSIRALAEHFGGEVTNYNLDFFGSTRSWMKFDMPKLDANEIENKLGQLGSYNPDTLKGNGDCELTGWCYDEDAIDGFRKAWHEGERDIDKLMKAAFQNWIKLCQSECSAFYGDESDEFAEHCEVNRYEFYKDGSLCLEK